MRNYITCHRSFFLVGTAIICTSLFRLLQSPKNFFNHSDLCDLAPHTIDAESALSCSIRLSLETADLYDLELIGGISDTRAEKILHSRAVIRSLAGWLRSEHRHRAFEVVYGIGARTATLLAQQIDPLSSRERLNQRFIPFRDEGAPSQKAMDRSFFQREAPHQHDRKYGESDTALLVFE